ncbi:MAG TPA: cobalt-precorrin-6A reductase [Pseudonocardia sp.]|nr:cobalt-precorrin-6A reductase [Pseudonocardia sp.]
MRVLILGGTGEARRLAGELVEAASGGLSVVSSLAGRVRDPVLPPGEVRVGGFGGVAGLRDYLRAERITAVVDATHPFAAVMSASAAAATAELGIPLLVLRRPGWTPGADDRWHRVPTLAAAAEALPALGRRVFLSTGRTGLAAFAGLDEHWFLVRSVDPPQPPAPRRMHSLLARGPFTLAGERALLREHRIDVLVTKDSGGGQTGAKLVAAGELGIPVVIQARPPVPLGVPVRDTVAGAACWLAELPAS